MSKSPACSQFKPFHARQPNWLSGKKVTVDIALLFCRPIQRIFSLLERLAVHCLHSQNRKLQRRQKRIDMPKPMSVNAGSK